ncbi:hypothetical protein BH10BAC2_BH10BAC2_40530 [soil metagenome]
MKKKALSLLTIGVVISATLIAQKSEKVNPGGIYIRGGYNAANISVNKDGSVNDAKTLSTFHFGATADIPLAWVLSFQTGLLLNGKGSKSNYYADASNHADNYVKSTFNPLYLELPANLVLKFPIGTVARLYVGAGPYAAMGIGGKSKTESSLLGVTSSTSENIKFNDDDPLTGEQEGARYGRLKRFDFGINALAGVEIKRFMVGVNYGLGLTKINSTQTDNSTDNNKYRTFSVGVGVKL